MDQVLRHLDREVPANRSGCRFLGIRRPDERAHDFPSLTRTLDDQKQCGAARDERDETIKEWLARVFGVMALRSRRVDGSQFGSDDTQLLSFEPSDDLTNKTALNAVGLHYDKGFIHEEKI